MPILIKKSWTVSKQGVVSYNAASVYLMTSKKPKEIKGVK